MDVRLDVDIDPTGLRFVLRDAAAPHHVIDRSVEAPGADAVGQAAAIVAATADELGRAGHRLAEVTVGGDESAAAPLRAALAGASAGAPTAAGPSGGAAPTTTHEPPTTSLEPPTTSLEPPTTSLDAPTDTSRADEPPTAVTPRPVPAVGPDLAYSAVPAPLPGVPTATGPGAVFSDNDPAHSDGDSADDDRAAARRRVLIGSTVAALGVAGFAVLAVGVAWTVRPDAERQTTRGYDEAVAGKYFPPAPGQGVEPGGPAWTVIEELPPPEVLAEGEPAARVFRPQSLDVSAAGDADVIRWYDDGTVGMASAAEPVWDTVAVPAYATAPAPQMWGTRFIPDYATWSPCQVLAMVSNVRQLGQTTVTTAGEVGAAVADALADMGETVVVARDRGPLFDAPVVPDDGGPTLGGIPEAFSGTSSGSGSGSRDAMAEALPSDTMLVDVDDLPAAAPTTSGTRVPGMADTSPWSLPLTPQAVEAMPGTPGVAPPEPPADSSRAPSDAPETPNTPGAPRPADAPSAAPTLPSPRPADEPETPRSGNPLFPGAAPQLPDSASTPPRPAVAPPTLPRPGLPEPAAPEPAAPEPAAPEPVLPRPSLPTPSLPKPAAPEPVVPKPSLPKPAAPEPVVPKPVAPEPVVPKPVVPKPAPPPPAPELSIPEPVVPQLPLTLPDPPAMPQLPDPPAAPVVPDLPVIPAAPAMPDLFAPWPSSGGSGSAPEITVPENPFGDIGDFDLGGLFGSGA